ncbi:hypothetical protein L596_026050 [Steinernema carpocapsae]|uniref:ShKT domain-containing protein n=1 Tax=Steinernema carpocapsae TaxID=34508 RepID=A0A4U5M098_STECR|nr:hypothetical protein L596_026050 [Steinernema carpocapsae]
MANIRLLFVSLALFSVVHLLPLDQASLPCKYYEEAEEKCQCGQNEYLIGFGKKWCNLLTQPELLKTFTKPGLKTVLCIRDCLINMTEKHIRESPLPFSSEQCKNLNQTEFDVFHPICYRGCGFCDLSVADVGEMLYNRMGGRFCK